MLHQTIEADEDAPAEVRVTVETIAADLLEAAGHAADALPELLVLGRGGEQFPTRLRPYLAEVTHCLASALEAVLKASKDAAAAGIGAPRGEGEEALAVIVRDYLDRTFG